MAIGIGFLAFNIVTMIQNVISVFMALATVIELVGAKQLITNAIMNANPIGILIALIAGLIAYIVHLYKTSDEFRMLISKIWEDLKIFGSSFVDLVKAVGNWLLDCLKKLWQGIKNIFSGTGDWFKNIFTSAWENVKYCFSFWGEFFEGLWDKIKNTFSNLGTSIGDAIGGTVKTAINGVIESIENTINGGVNLINGAIDLINCIPGVSVGYMDGLSLPRLAKGGIVDNPTLAQIGEQGREAIIPLENNLGWIKNLANQLAMQINQGIGFNSTSSSVVNNFYQTNNSPKALSRLEIYRQSKNLLSLKGA